VAGVADLVAAAFPTGTVTTDTDGVRRYTLSNEDVRKLRNLMAGALKDSGGKPLLRISRADEAIVPAVLDKFGIHLALGIGAVFLLGRLSVPKGRR